jgi:hypothetical protein
VTCNRELLRFGFVNHLSVYKKQKEILHKYGLVLYPGASRAGYGLTLDYGFGKPWWFFKKRLT